MSRRDEAVETMARAWVDTLVQRWRCGRTWGQLSAKERRGYLDLAQAALTAALAVLQPTVPNKVEALDALPVGTVLRGDAREEGVIVAHLTCLGWTEGEVPYDSTRLLFRHADLLGIDSWRVLWTPEDES